MNICSHCNTKPATRCLPSQTHVLPICENCYIENENREKENKSQQENVKETIRKVKKEIKSDKFDKLFKRYVVDFLDKDITEHDDGQWLRYDDVKEWFMKNHHIEITTTDIKNNIDYKI